MIKSVLEHTANVEDAVALLKDAMALASEEVFVAWHRPPDTSDAHIARVVGHFGKTINQNRYNRKNFDFARPRKVEQVDNFELWTINVRESPGLKTLDLANTPARRAADAAARVTVLLPAGIVEDFVMVPDGRSFRAYYTRGDSFQNQRIYSRWATSPTGPINGTEGPFDSGGTHTRLYKGRLNDRARLISAIWPGLPRCGIWCFTDLAFGMAKSMVIPPTPDTGYSYAAANPCVRLRGERDQYEIFFEGCPDMVVPGQPFWKIFRATWDGRGVAKVDPVPVVDGANPSLLEVDGKTYLYFSRLTPGGYAAGFETCVVSL